MPLSHPVHINIYMYMILLNGKKIKQAKPEKIVIGSSKNM